MKSMFKWTSLPIIAICLLGFSLASFKAKPGGEGFEIFLDNKLLVQSFGNDLKTVQSLQLDPKSTGQLSIKYHHCGKAGKNRVVAIRDAQNQTLKEWRFADVKDPYSSMSCSVKEILNLQKGGKSNTVGLYYTSSELPKGRMLASLVLPAKNVVAP